MPRSCGRNSKNNGCGNYQISCRSAFQQSADEIGKEIFEAISKAIAEDIHKETDA